MTHYDVLGLTREATPKEIRKAYHRIARKTHPDKALDKQDQFLAIKTAYEVLSDPIRRAAYDRGEAVPHDRKTFDLKRPSLLLLEPHRLNHYEFTNRLFKIDEKSIEYLRPGQPISDWDKNRLYWQLHTLSGRLHKQHAALSRQREKLAEIKQKIDMLKRNEKKIGQVISVLTCEEGVKLLYDFSLGPDVVQTTYEMSEIDRLIGVGGRERLAEHIKVHPQIYTAGSIFAMRDAGCLTPGNFEQIIEGKDRYEFFDIYGVLEYLRETNLLNQANFDLLMANKQHSHPILHGTCCLKVSGQLHQSFFEELVESGERAEILGSARKTLNDCNLMNDANWQMVIELSKKTDIDLLLDRCLLALEKRDDYTEEKADALKWRGEGALHPLSLRIDEMFAYGIHLLSEDTSNKAETAMLLALELKLELKTFFEKPKEEQRRMKDSFMAKFEQTLCSRDADMAEHRTFWKVIVANIAIGFAAAMTVVGLFALGGYYLYSGQCLFSKTKREKLRDAIKEDALRAGVCRTGAVI